MSTVVALSPGQLLTGPLFNEPMRVETVQPNGPASWVLGLVGTQSERFRKVALTTAELAQLTVLETSDHMLLLTATPHKGDPQNFSLFLQLLDADAYADVKSIREAMDRRRAPFYLRRTKEAMVYFPERRPDGSWAAEPIFTKRIPHTVDFQIDGPEFDLYRDVTRFVKRESARAAAEGEDPRARAIGFLMSLYQRRLASSTFALCRSLENRARRLEEGLKRAQDLARLDVLGKGATFHSLQHEHPARIDFYRVRIVDGLGQVVHERLFAVEIAEGGEPRLQEPGLLGNFAPAEPPAELPSVAFLPEQTSWLHEHALAPFLEETRKDRLTEIERVSAHVELSLTELLQRADEEIGRAANDVEQKLPGAEGRLAQAEARHAELLARRERRRTDLERQRALTLQAVERLASVLVLPHPEREAPEVRRLKPNFETEAIAMRVVMEHERAQGRQVYDVSEKNLGYDVTSLDLASGELRLIEVKGLGASTGTILLTPNERRVAEDRRDCYWLYVVTDCDTTPRLQEPIKDPARLDWNEVTKVAHYYLSVDAMAKPMQVRDDSRPYGGNRP